MALKFGHKKLYIGGALVESSDNKQVEVICPADEKACATLAWASKEDTEQALQEAKSGFEYWSRIPLKERLGWIEKLRQEIIKNENLLRETIMYEMGKVWEHTEEDFTSITDALKYYPEEIKKRTDIAIPDKEGTHEHKLVHQPLGVVVAFLAYNFPLLNLGFKLGPALSAGCSIVIKPSEFSPLSTHIIGELAHGIDFPKGVINVISGDLDNVGKPLSTSKIPRLITMIGSTETAQALIGQSSKTSIKRYSMECGGNAPFIVSDDSELEKAIELGSALKIGNTGQTCVSPNRFIVHKNIVEDFIKGMIDKFKSVKLGFDREDQPNMGPLANKQSVDKILNIIGKAIDQGGVLRYGGSVPDRSGYYLEPAIVYLNDPFSEILQHEIFGPVALVVPYSNNEEALEIANNTDAGLASYVFSSSKKTLDYFSENLEFGEVQLNGVKYDIYLPHGGVKNSGIGVDCSPYALDDYLIKKRVSLTIT